VLEIGSEDSLERGGVTEMGEPVVFEGDERIAIELTRAAPSARLGERSRGWEACRERNDECEERQSE
jgi:hypothetical protein